MSEHESLKMIHNLLHLVPILQRFFGFYHGQRGSHRPRLGCETYHPQGARPVLGCSSWGWLKGCDPEIEVAKRTSMPPSATSKTSIFGLDSWFRPLDFFNLGRNPICVGCTKFKLITSSTLIPFRGSNTPFWWHKKRHIFLHFEKTGPESTCHQGSRKVNAFSLSCLTSCSCASALIPSWAQMT